MADTTKSVRPAWVDDDLFPFESRFVDIDDCDLRALACEKTGCSVAHPRARTCDDRDLVR